MNLVGLPVNLVFFYIALLKSLNLVLIPGAKLYGHRGTWTECCVINSCTTSCYTFPISQIYLSIIHEPFNTEAYLSLPRKIRLKKIMIHDYTIL